VKTELRLAQHSIFNESSSLPGANIIEIWWNGQFIGQVTGLDNRAGIRVLSKYSIQPNPEPIPASDPAVPVAVFELVIGR
jgi:hypothetical protein